MTLLHRLASIVRWIARRDRAERDLDDELRTFVEMAAADNVGDGQTPAEARRQALLRLGGLEQAKERVRTARHGAWLDEFGRDLRQAMRQARRNPAFSAAAITTLGLGIGVAVAVYSLVHAVLLRPLPYDDPDRLVRIESRNVGQGGVLQGVSLPDLEDFRRRTRTLTGIGAYRTGESQILGDGRSTVAMLTHLNPAAMNILGVRAHLGRLLTPEDDQPGADAHKVVIGYSLWTGHFGGDPNVIGRVLRTDDTSYTVVGVMPPGFAFPRQTSMWAPIESQFALLPPERRIRRRGARFNNAIARVSSGVTLAQAEAELNSVAAALEYEYPKENAGVRVKLTALREFETGDLRPYLYLLLAGVGMMTLTSCANVAGLQLVRGMSRQREAALQAALGAGRGRIVRQRLAESAVLAAAGGALGIGLAMVIVNLMLALIPVGLPFWMTIRIDGPVLAFAVVLTAATCVVFGLLPALRASQVDADALKAGDRLASAGGRLQSALVIGEVSLSVLLLVCAALLMQTLARLQRIDPGFTPDGLVTARVLMHVPPGPFPQHAEIVRGAHARMLDAIRRQPGVTAVAFTSALPFTGTQTERPEEPLVIRGQADKEVVAPLSGSDVSPGYFRAMGIPLRRGRLFDESDTREAPYVVVINERGARTLWPDRDPLGQEIVWGVPSAVNPYARVVGIVADLHHQAAERDNGIELYYPLAQFPMRQGYVVVRVGVDPHAMADTIRQTIETDPTMAVAEVKSMDQRIDESLWQRRLWGVLFAGFASLALLVAAVGLYGTVSHSVAQRTRELGIRVALGDRPTRMGAMIVREGMMLVVSGVAIGIVGALGAGRLITGLLHGVPAHDPGTIAAVALVLFAAGLAALVIPARRASRVDPIVALRAD